MPYSNPFDSPPMASQAPGTSQTPAPYGSLGTAPTPPDQARPDQAPALPGPFGSTPVSAAPSPFRAGSAGVAAATGLTVHRPPVLILAAGVLLAVAGALGAWLSGAVPVAAVGWLLAGPVAFGLLALYQHRDAVAQSRGVYTRDPWVAPAFYAGVALCFVAVCVCAIRIALWAGRL